jgi:hypothetical protein
LPIGDGLDRIVTRLELLFIDERIVNPVDVQLSQLVIGHRSTASIVAEADGLKKVHINNRGAGGDDDIDHIISDHIDVGPH